MQTEERNENIVHTERLENGACVEFIDRSNRYYGDYHRVRVEVRCALALVPELFASFSDPAAECERVKLILGPEVVYANALEKMGVAGAEVESVVRSLIQGFVTTTLIYLNHPEFAARLVRSTLEQRKKFKPGRAGA